MYSAPAPSEANHRWSSAGGQHIATNDESRLLACKSSDNLLVRLTPLNHTSPTSQLEALPDKAHQESRLLTMISRTARAFALGALALASAASAFQNYSSSYAGVEALRAQLALMDDRPSDCPPWFVSRPLVAFWSRSWC